MVSVPMPTSAPPKTSNGWCMPRYIRDTATMTGTAMANVRAVAAEASVWGGRSQQQHEARVDRDRRGRVPGGVTATQREILETSHPGARTRDEVQRQAVRRRLDGEQTHDEDGDRPVPARRRHDDDQARQRREHGASAETGDHGGRVRERRCAPGDERVDDAVVGLSDPADVQDHVGDQRADQHRHHGERDEAGQQREHENRGGRPPRHPRHQALGRPGRCRTQQRRHPAGRCSERVDGAHHRRQASPSTLPVMRSEREPVTVGSRPRRSAR